MDLFLYQVKQAYLSLKQKPGFVLSIVSTMGITLGALLCILTLAYVMLIKPLPYPEQDRLYVTSNEHIDEQGRLMFESFSYPALMALYQQTDVFSKKALVAYSQGVLNSHQNLPMIEATFISPQWFKMTNMPIMLGRAFEATEAIDSFNPVTVISYKTWLTTFSSDPDIIGKSISFNDSNFRIIGVTQKNYIEPQIYSYRRGVSKYRQTELWLPWDFNSAALDVRKIWWQTTNGMLIGKLSIDNYANQAAQIFSTLINELWLEAIVGDERFTGKTQKIALHSFKKVIVGDNKKVVYLLLAGIIGLLIIAFSNIANLMMSRAMTQQRIMTIHAAIGAKRANIFSALLSESLILMCFSMLIALIVSFVGFELIERFFGASLSRSAEMSNNLFTVGISVVILLVLSLLLATVATKTVIQSQLFATLNTGGKGIGSQVSKLFRQLLIICQVTVASVLIFISATLFKESFYSINTSSGLNVSNVMALTLASSTSDVPSAEQAIPVLDEIKEKLSFLPQVHAISHTKSPFESFERWWPGLTTLEDNQKLNVVYRVVDEQYFSLLSQQHILGNVFDKNDVLEQSNVMIVNDMVAKRLEPSGQVLGKKVFFRDDRIFTIIGVVKGVHLPAEKDIGERVYIPRSAVYDLTTREKLSLVIKLKENQQLTRQQVVNTIKEVSSSFSVKSLESLSDTRFQRLFNQYVTTMVTAILTVLSLVLAAIGLYGILSYSSQMRRFEIGTRLAIGAKGKDIVILIIKENLVPLIVGIAVSFIVVWGLYLNFNEYLPVDFVAEIVTLFVMTVCLIGIISFIACYLPLRQYINQPAIHSLKGSE